MYPWSIFMEFCWTENKPILSRSHRRCSIKKVALKNFPKFTGKHLCQSLFFNKVAISACRKRLWRCFPVNFLKFLRVLFLKNTFGRLLLTFVLNVIYLQPYFILFFQTNSTRRTKIIQIIKLPSKRVLGIYSSEEYLTLRQYCWELKVITLVTYKIRIRKVLKTLFWKVAHKKMFRSSRPLVFCKIDVLRNFVKFTGKHLCQSHFLNGLQLY